MRRSQPHQDSEDRTPARAKGEDALKRMVTLLARAAAREAIALSSREGKDRGE